MFQLTDRSLGNTDVQILENTIADMIDTHIFSSIPKQFAVLYAEK